MTTPVIPRPRRHISLRGRWGDEIAFTACTIVDDIDRETGLALTSGWRPLAFDPSLPPVPQMEPRTA